MIGKFGKLGTAGVLSLAVLAAGRACAEAPCEDGAVGKHAKCPKPSYSPLHYWVPAVDRCYAFYSGRPLHYIYAPVSYPTVPLHFQSTRYPCPPVPPAVFASNYPWFPTPPGVPMRQ
jgi:hypothetical protein